MGGKCKMTRTHIHSLPEKHGQTGQLKQSGKIGNKQVDSRSIVVGMITYSYSTSPQCGLHISHSARFSTTTYINLVPPTASPAAPPHGLPYRESIRLPPSADPRVIPLSIQVSPFTSSRFIQNSCNCSAAPTISRRRGRSIKSEELQITRFASPWQYTIWQISQLASNRCARSASVRCPHPPTLMK